MPRDPRANTPQKFRYREEHPSGEEPGQPGGNHQTDGKRQRVNADALGPRGLNPISQTLEELRRRSNAEFMGR